MSYKDYSAAVEFEGCRYDVHFKDKINEIITSMEKNDAPYTGKFTLIIERVGDEVKTTTKTSEGLNEDEKRMLDALEGIGQAVSRKGGKPNKIKGEATVEKE